MSPQDITHLLIQYRYWVLLPFAILEGPIVAFIAGTLAALGYFNIFVLILFFFARDMAMDAIYYYVGYFGARTTFVKNLLQKMNMKEDRMSDIRSVWEKHPARTMFIGKMSYGIAQAFIVAAGVVKMRIQTFFEYGALAAITQYGALIVAGYFFGNAFGGTSALIVQNIQYVIAVGTLFLSGYYILRWHMRRHFPGEA